MSTVKKPDQNKSKRRPPATTPEAQENYMISLAMDLVEKRLIEGTATSQETTHFLKLGSIKQQRELALLEEEIELKKAKTEEIKSAKKSEEIYAEALNAMRKYSGNSGGSNND